MVVISKSILKKSYIAYAAVHVTFKKNSHGSSVSYLTQFSLDVDCFNTYQNINNLMSF